FPLWRANRAGRCALSVPGSLFSSKHEDGAPAPKGSAIADSATAKVGIGSTAPSRASTHGNTGSSSCAKVQA
ncbi:MAG TPA: hypothetical protein VI320_20275, partial [Terracidiphilus sp.]